MQTTLNFSSKLSSSNFVEKDTIQQYTDDEFPANADSINGRKVIKINSNSNSVVSKTTTKEQLCKCNLVVKLKQVQKQNQNQGRYFTTCSLNVCNHFQWADYHEHSAQVSENVEWIRFTSDQGWKMISNSTGFKPEHVRQGGVGDCWFLSAVAVLAEREDIINSIVLDKTLRSDGIQRFCLFINGEFKIFQVDNFLACISKTGQATKKAKKSHNEDKLMFSHSSNSCLWVPLLEKAYAKAHGSYFAIHGGWIREALLDLTGAPTETISFGNRHFDSDNTFIRLLSFKESKFPMGASTSHTAEGIVGHHAYSIIDVREINGTIGEQQSMTSFISSSSNEHSRSYKQSENNTAYVTENNTLRLIRLRNPWGHKEFTGGFGSNSSLWTTKLRNLLDSGSTNDGTFWMSYHDFLIRFESFEVCKVHTKDWFNQSYRCYFKDQIKASANSKQSASQSVVPLSTSTCHFLVYSMVALESTWMYLFLVQKTKRGAFSSSSDRLYYYKSLGLIVVDTDGNVIGAIYSGCCRDTQALELQVRAGNYTIIIINFDNHMITSEYDFVLRCYASQPLIIEKSSNDESDHRKIVTSAFSSSLRLSNSNYASWLTKEFLFSTTIPSADNNVVDLTDDFDFSILPVTSKLQFNLLKGKDGFFFILVENDSMNFLKIQVILRTANCRVHYDGSTTTQVRAHVVKKDNNNVSNNGSSSSSSNTYKIKQYTETKFTNLSVNPKSSNVMCYLISWPLDEDGEDISGKKNTTRRSSIAVINEVIITEICLGDDKVSDSHNDIPYCPIAIK